VPSDDWVVAGLQGLRYGGIEIANSGIQLLSLGFDNINETAEYYGNVVSDSDRAATRLAANAGVNALAALVTPVAASRLAGSSLGQIAARSSLVRSVAQSQATGAVGRGAGYAALGYNAANTASNTIRGASDLAHGRTHEGLAHLFAAAENGVGAWHGWRSLLGPRLTAAFARPKRVAVPEAPNRTAVAEEGGLNLFKWNQPTSTRAVGWREGDRFLYLPNQGSARANWVQNSTRLRQEMRSGRPIFDSHVDDAGNLIPTPGFLNAERNLLMNRGWTFNPSAGAWQPPVGNK
jgi:hypothetical protein